MLEGSLSINPETVKEFDANRLETNDVNGVNGNDIKPLPEALSLDDFRNPMEESVLRPQQEGLPELPGLKDLPWPPGPVYSVDLMPNIEYTTGEYDYRYTTDDMGRISSFQTDELHLTERDERLPHDSGSPDKRVSDDAGHLIGDRFGGSPRLDNIVSQDSHVNRSEYKSMEDEWAKAVNDGKHVEVSGELSYDDDSKRPSSFDVYYSIDGELYEKSFINGSE